MKIIFEKKIIIGSIFGILTTIIGTIAIFFPDLFNLEKKKIIEFNGYLQSYDDAKKLYDFLLANDKSIIKLNLKYTEKNVKATKIDEKIKYMSNNGYIEGNELYNSAWNITYRFREGSEFIINPFIDSNNKKHLISYSEIDGIGEIFLISEHIIPAGYLSTIQEPPYRQNGGFGIWYGDRYGENQCSNYGENCITKIMFQIYFPDKYSEDIHFYWRENWNKNTYKNISNEKEMIIEGIFFVKASKSNYKIPTIFYDRSFYDLYENHDGEFMQKDIVFELTALNKKELSLMQY